jgi:hypothetical protein
MKFGSPSRSAIRGDNRGGTPVLLLHAIRPFWVSGDGHAINKDELGFQIIYPSFRDRIYRFSLDIRKLFVTETREIFGQTEDCGHQKTKTAKGI